MARLGWILFLIMTLIASGLVYKFIIKGETAVAPDGRSSLLLKDSERDFLLSEMRNFLITVQQITEGIEKDDMTQIAAAAKKAGFADAGNAPAGLVAKLPLEAKKMGHATHAAFDQMAMDAEQLGDKEHTLSQLNQILPICIACHSLYKVR